MSALSKTAIAAYVGLAVALYTSLSGQKVAPEVVNNIVNWVVMGVGFAVSALAFYKTHKKAKANVDKSTNSVVK